MIQFQLIFIYGMRCGLSFFLSPLSRPLSLSLSSIFQMDMWFSCKAWVFKLHYLFSVELPLYHCLKPIDNICGSISGLYSLMLNCLFFYQWYVFCILWLSLLIFPITFCAYLVLYCSCRLSSTPQISGYYCWYLRNWHMGNNPVSIEKLSLMSKMVSLLTQTIPSSVSTSSISSLPRVVSSSLSLVASSLWGLFMHLFSPLYSAHSNQSSLFLKYKLDPVAPLLKTFLWWLPILLRMKLKFLTMAFKTMWTYPLPASLTSHNTLFTWLPVRHIGLFLLSLGHSRHLLDWGCVHQLFHL